eukprot:TRINITY_DN1477_c0_g2_i2.p1 TRINITY_DN1477_c0_g2~~TRINITY_DN1477_c0_g2_i2.p1  ORF type:complete len:230 (+),score=41.11 TRINITY_DN1477_c0_g2_i2:83-691(+)
MPISTVGGPVTYAQPVSTLARPVTYAQPAVAPAVFQSAPVVEEIIEVVQQPITYAAPAPIVQRPRDLIGNYGVVYERNVTREELLQEGRLTADPAREEQLMLQAGQKAGFIENHLAFQTREMLEMKMIEYAKPAPTVVREVVEEMIEVVPQQAITYAAPQVMEVVQQPTITYGGQYMTGAPVMTAAPVQYVTAAQPQVMMMR